MTLAAHKAALRAEALKRRGHVTAQEAEAFAERLAEFGAGLALQYKSEIASGFWPIKDEASTLPLLARLSAQGLVTALPVIIGRDQPLTFRAWKEGEPLIKAQMKIMEPPETAPEVFPDLVFVPLAAYDRRGNRLGYGAGFYDRSLARLRQMKKIVAVGVAFELQELPELPQEPHDEPLDYVLTDRSLITCAQG